ncbi:MAG: cytochrome c [Sphingobacteriales bacterium]|uniref:c-type cytochrome n=1 Tax=Hydrotalea flava TaxID=714549 RepID=UPI00082C1C22|nr:cytochrome c [Hydrotalea flava]RTL54860.1 MAG: cytochrome c [Sphingobacteriales bacterium]
MDFPMFHLDWLNDRFLIAMIAILHVLINHGIAVGFVPYIVWLEQKGVCKSNATEITDTKWDGMAERMMKVAFIVTTTVGAMTGVGIWFSAALVSPASIGSLIRVFYWAWFTEWTIFVTEVVLIMVYYLTWKNSNQSLQSKLKHIKFGWYLSVFSWFTMAIIVAILGFMMDPGNWNKHHSFINGFTNPIYLPQLFFRTPTAMVIAGTFGYLLVFAFTQKNTETRKQAIQTSAKWILFWIPFSVLGAVYYYKAMPAAMRDNMSTAVGTIEFQQYYQLLKYIILGATSSIFLIALLGLLKPGKVRWGLVLFPTIMAFGFLGIFERVREFIRKPYVIGGYMYSNLLRKEDYPLYQRDGILKYATYNSTPEITATNKIEAGRNVFMLSCSRCHTTQGINSITYVFERMYGSFNKPLDENAMAAYIPNMHNGRTFMPPFPGNQKEAEALAAYLKFLQQSHETLEGVQTAGVVVNSLNNIDAAIQIQQTADSVKAVKLAKK